MIQLPSSDWSLQGSWRNSPTQWIFVLSEVPVNTIRPGCFGVLQPWGGQIVPLHKTSYKHVMSMKHSIKKPWPKTFQKRYPLSPGSPLPCWLQHSLFLRNSVIFQKYTTFFQNRITSVLNSILCTFIFKIDFYFQIYIIFYSHA